MSATSRSDRTGATPGVEAGSQETRTRDGSADLSALFHAKARAELKAADGKAPGSDIVRSAGAEFAETALVKGLSGPAEATGGSALEGPDGDAADRALEALGYDPALSFRIVSRVEQGVASERRIKRLRLALEATDPDVVIALDKEAAEDVASAFDIAELRFGRPVRVLGRTLVAVDGLEASLTDEARKRRVWRQLKSVRRDAQDGAAV